MEIPIMKPLLLAWKAYNDSRFGLQVNKAPEFSFRFNPTPMTLFRYSALTFNSHLIHYDHIYATTVEHHPGKFSTICGNGFALTSLIQQLTPFGVLQLVWSMAHWWARC
jgi:hydroxyacyl-ACP dehydratase HTD2-like protein with hotdog domain